MRSINVVFVGKAKITNGFIDEIQDGPYSHVYI